MVGKRLSAVVVWQEQLQSAASTIILTPTSCTVYQHQQIINNSDTLLLAAVHRRSSINLSPFVRHTTPCTTSHRHIHRVSKNYAKLFLSQLRQISTNFDNGWHKDGTKKLKLCEVHSFSISTNSRQRILLELSKLVEIWRSSDKKILHSFWDTMYAEP